MSSFTITTANTSVNLRPSSLPAGQTASGSVTYSVTNRTGESIRARLRLVASDSADESWFEVRDGDEKDIGPGETAIFSIDLAVPPGEAGHSVRAIVINLKDPDNDFEEGSAVAFDAPALLQDNGGKPFPWWWLVAGISLVLVVVLAIVLIVALGNGDDEDDNGEDDPDPPVVVGGEVRFHEIITESRLIAANEYAEYGLVDIEAAPTDAYCAEAVAAITTRNKPGLTTGTVARLNRCNTVPIAIEFANAVQTVTIEFYGSAQPYDLTAFDASGAVVGSASQAGVLYNTNAPPATVRFAAGSATIKKITFGKKQSMTLVHSIKFE